MKKVMWDIMQKTMGDVYIFEESMKQEYSCMISNFYLVW